ncbi:hypothetical protein YT1_4639 [Rhodococcus ruber]|nr:hypothetical protein YT1_4639 [Rhodococcus ruber]
MIEIRFDGSVSQPFPAPRVESVASLPRLCLHVELRCHIGQLGRLRRIPARHEDDPAAVGRLNMVQKKRCLSSGIRTGNGQHSRRWTSRHRRSDIPSLVRTRAGSTSVISALLQGTPCREDHKASTSFGGSVGPREMDGFGGEPAGATPYTVRSASRGCVDLWWRAWGPKAFVRNDLAQAVCRSTHFSASVRDRRRIPHS